MATRYSQPRKFNPVSFIALIVLAGLGYGAFKFGPPYYREYKVKEALLEAATRIYPKRMLTGVDELEFMSEVERSTTSRIREVGVKDPGLRVITRKTNTEIRVEARYLETIFHPFGVKPTELPFGPFSVMSIQND
jgi:hypothetical protein